MNLGLSSNEFNTVNVKEKNDHLNYSTKWAKDHDIKSKKSILIERKKKRASVVQTQIENKRESTNVNTMEVDIPQESRVSKRLSDLTTKKVIMLVLTMVICLGFFEVEFWLPIDED